MMVSVPVWLRIFYPSPVWKKDSDKLFLTFDDGPHPEMTPKILKILEEYNVKATFFCVGDNVKRYPKIYNEILKKGHKTGNHSFNHLNGWKTGTDNYVQNVKKASRLIESNLFRPPYGKIKRSQIKSLKKDFKIIMWTTLTYDFSKSITPETCYHNSLKGLKKGNIIVFHDNIKSEKNLFYALPKFLKNAKEKGFEFDLI